MKKLVVGLSILSVCILLIPLVSPLVYSQHETPQETIPIETVISTQTGSKKHTIHISSSEVAELRHLLILLDEALAEKDNGEIHRYEMILKSKGIIPACYQFKTTSPILKPSYQNIRPLLAPLNEDTISNTMCYVHATGSGLLVFTLGVLLIIPTLILLSIFGFDILKVLLPLLIITMIVTHMIPFRILLPIGVIILEKGNVSAVGTAGSQQITVDAPSVQVNLIGFTGITINIPSSNLTKGFLFVSGFSFYAYSQNTSQNYTIRLFDHNRFFCTLKNSMLKK